MEGDKKYPYKRIVIAQHERGLLFRNRQLTAVLEPGVHHVIKRREETAATRSLLDTAKLMDENPTLMRLKELEALEKVADKVDRLTVFGGLDGVLNDTVRIGVKAD